jgi:hypothetical protein
MIGISHLLIVEPIEHFTFVLLREMRVVARNFQQRITNPGFDHLGNVDSRVG